MIVVVDQRNDVSEAYKSAISREGYSAAAFGPLEFEGWFHSLTEEDIGALNDIPALEMTLRLFEAGADDVVRKPVHVREILARIALIRRRSKTEENALWSHDGLVVFGGGRSPMINGAEFQVPRRELRILEHLAANRGRRSTRAQIFAAVYGIFDERVEECVVESHISKLRKKLRMELGHDPIDMQRYLGYQLMQKIAQVA
jgi:two-component system, OmpR family, flagellar system response regulator FtcR